MSVVNHDDGPALKFANREPVLKIRLRCSDSGINQD